jgi:hypothetical protein
MKLIAEMTHEEIIALTNEDIERMVKYLCARDGVVFLDAPVVPIRPEVEFDGTIYSVGGIYSHDREFLHQLQNLVSLNISKLRKLDYDWQVGSEYKTPSPPATYELEQWTKIEASRCVSEEKYRQQKHALIAHKKTQDQYDKDKKQWEENSKAIDHIRADICEVWNEHRSKEREYERHIERFKEYRGLAGDEETAIKFYRRAYPVNSDMALRLWGIE